MHGRLLPRLDRQGLLYKLGFVFCDASLPSPQPRNPRPPKDEWTTATSIICLKEEIGPVLCKLDNLLAWTFFEPGIFCLMWFVVWVLRHSLVNCDLS